MRWWLVLLTSILLCVLSIGPVQAMEISTTDKLITVDTGKQMLYAWEGGQIVHQTKISTGMKKTPTVLGSFKVRKKVALQDMKGYSKDYGRWDIKDVPNVMYFYQGYAIHGTHWHNSFGRVASHGCVNVPVKSSEWLYNWAQMGTRVEVY